MLFHTVRLNAKTMPQHPHPVQTHMDIPDFDGLVAFMRSNPSLARSVHHLEVRGFLTERFEPEDIVATFAGGGVSNEDEFMWMWEPEAEDSRRATAIRWTKLPWPMLLAIISTPRLLPSLRELTLDSLFVHFPAQVLEEISADTILPLERLTLRKVGTTVDTNRALLQFMNIFDPLHLTLDKLPFRHDWFDDSLPTAYDEPHLTLSIMGPKQTTSLEIEGVPNACPILDVFRRIPFVKNIAKLEIRITDGAEVGTLSNLLKMIGGGLKELTVDLKPVCWACKPEVHLSRAFYDF